MIEAAQASKAVLARYVAILKLQFTPTKGITQMSKKMDVVGFKTKTGVMINVKRSVRTFQNLDLLLVCIDGETMVLTKGDAHRLAAELMRLSATIDGVE